MKVYVIMQYHEDELKPIKVFDNREAAESYINCFSNRVAIFEMDVESTNTYVPKYVLHTVTWWNQSKVCCNLPYAKYDIDCALEDPYFHVAYEDWNPKQKILLEVDFAVCSKEIGNRFAKLANDTIDTANSMLEAHTFEEIKQFITDTLQPVMEEIRIKA